MPWRIHSLMQNADHRDAVILDTEVDEMPPYGTAPIARPDMAAILRSGGRFGQCGAGVLQRQGVTHGLLQAPLLHGIVENSVQIAMRGGT